MLGKVETAARVEKSQEGGQQRNLSEQDNVDMRLQEVGNSVRVVSRDSTEPSERDRGRRRGNDDEEKSERPEVAFSLSLDIV
jgi:hypothetical protein